MDMSACNTCGKSVKDRNSIKCNLCQAKVHLKCNDLNYVESQYINLSNKAGHCYKCYKNLFPFTLINHFKLYPFLSDKNYCNSDSNELYLALNSPKNYHNHLVNLILSQLQTFKEFTDKSSYSLFILNTHFLKKNTDEH